MPAPPLRLAVVAAWLGALLPLGDDPAPRSLEPDSGFAVPESVRVELTNVTGMARAGDGSLFLTDARLPALLQLAPDGSLRRVLGRAGGGPGEFSIVSRVGIMGDSVWALDMGWHRLTFFPVAGPGVATLSLQEMVRADCARRPSQGGACMPMTIGPGRTFLLAEYMVASPERDTPSDHGIIFRATPDFRITDTVTQYPIRHSSMVFTSRTSAAHLRQPFADGPLPAPATNGAYLAVVERDVAARNRGAGFTVSLFGAGGERLWRRVVPYTPRPLTGAEVDSALGVIIDILGQGPGRMPLTLDSLRAKVYRPKYHPPVRQAVTGQDGTVWLGLTTATSPALRTEWLALGPRGEPVARVSTRPGFRLLEADRRTLWGVEGDWDDVPRVVRYSVPAVTALN